MSQEFWDRNWAVAESLGEPTPPIKGVNEYNIPIYCSLMEERAVYRGFRCICGCTEMLQTQKRLIRHAESRVRKDELAVMGWIKPRRAK
jgi:hypothetical protein